MDLFASSEDEKKLLNKTLLLINQSEEISDKKAAEDRINELRGIISQHDQLYYGQSKSIISDKDYDFLFSSLKKLENEYPEFFSEESPTQRLGDILQEDLKSVKHLKPMLSLDNSYNIEDLNKFDKRVKDGLPDSAQIEYAVELKYDGSSIAIVYENDLLVRGATRGNGLEGDDITENTKVIKGVPLKVNFSNLGIHKIEVRGEVVINLKVFEQINFDRAQENIHLREKGKRELELFKNPRNTAAGSLRMKDVKEVKKRGLEAFIYQVGYAEDIQGNDVTDQIRGQHIDYIQLLDDLGFNTGIQSIARLDNMDAISDYCLEWQDKRDTYPIDIDGMVIKLNSILYQNMLGKTAHHPKWAIAYKFKARQARSILRKVDYQVGRTGAITPVAKIDPVQLMGVEISSISLHNEDFIKDKDILLGDTVIVERAGDVIPYIIGPDIEKRDGTQEPINFPENCSSCEHHLVRLIDESAWRCINPDCPAQIEERLIHFASVNAMDIQGLGQEIIKTFLREGLINSITDIFQLDSEKILTIEGFKQKSVNNLKNSIEQSKKNESWRLLTGLGIRHIGVTTAKMLTREVEYLTDFKNWEMEEYLQLKDVGPKVALSLFDFFHDDFNIQLIENLAALGVNIKSEELKLNSEKLKDLTFLFTGTMPSLSRDEGKNLVELNGGKILSSVSSNLNYLVAGEKAGSKLTKAEKISSIQIIDETEFLEMIS
ncbi:MAG TPA: NAD-dependent DNA ligase LigA [Chitinophagales bacterium]|nr:NAD-dependent DNA ligase LigA [Chitinophagales bacterium]